MFNVPGANLVLTEGADVPFYVDFDNVYIDKNVVASEVNLKFFAAAFSDYTQKSSTPPSLSSLVESHMLQYWYHAFCFIKDYMNPHMSFQYSFEACTSVLNRIVKGNIPEFLEKHLTNVRIQKTEEEAVSVSFTFPELMITTKGIGNYGRSIEMSGHWSETHKVYVPARDSTEKGRVTAILGKTLKPMSMEEFNNSLTDGHYYWHKSFGFIVGTKQSDFIFSPILTTLLTAKDLVNDGVRAEHLQEFGYCYTGCELTIPKVVIETKKIKIGGYRLYADEPVDQIISAKKTSTGEWKTTGSNKLHVPMEREEAYDRFFNFLSDPASDQLLDKKLDVWHREGDIIFISSKGEKEKDQGSAVISIKDRNIDFVAYMAKSDGLYALAYDKKIPDSQTKTIVERTFLAYKLQG